MEDGKLGEDEENYKVLRHDLASLYTNTLLVGQMKERALQTLHGKISELDPSSASQNEIELPLYLLSQMHATISRDDKDLTNPVYQSLLNEFMKTDFLG